ncbi:MAG: acetylglutamate kinase [Muribaculaceae bacterium]|nr:acetylglutamate kinase [Muribaculaceae bacterium]MDE7459425.1 acetylglutamate kinase [Muribaculaceae bacterium]
MITVVKIGGNVIDNPEALKAFIADFAKMPGKKILVHGGGKEATRLSATLGIETKMIGGRRVTDRATLDVVTMVYAGLINKRIVALLQAEGCNAIGLSGADGNVIRATRRNPEPVDYGYVGDINDDGVNAAFIISLLDKGVTPVFSAINHDGNGELLNCNADSVASAVAVACSRLAPVSLTFCFEKSGVLTDVDDESTLISRIDLQSYRPLIESGAISGGMLPKIDNAFKAIQSGVEKVVIKSSARLLADHGTTITK